MGAVDAGVDETGGAVDAGTVVVGVVVEVDVVVVTSSRADTDEWPPAPHALRASAATTPPARREILEIIWGEGHAVGRATSPGMVATDGVDVRDPGRGLARPWGDRGDSNPRPPGPQPGALTN